MDDPENITSRRYLPVGLCIYCGKHEGEFSDEHIIPYALAGSSVLPESSCSQCATETGRFEQICCRLMFDPLRYSLKMPSRKGKKRRLELPLSFVDQDGKMQTTIVPTAEHPTGLFLPKFEGARILLGLPEFQAETVSVKFWRYGPPEKKLDEIGRRHKAKALAASVNMLAMARLIAKIGHSYATAELGLHSFRPLLTDLIRGVSQNWGHVVGGTFDDEDECGPGFHAVRLDKLEVYDHLYLVARIRLFSKFGAPWYHAAVG